MDLAEKANFFTMDVIVDLATGAPFGNLSEDKDMHDYSRTMAELQPIFAIVGVLGAVSRIIQIPSIGRFFFPTAKDNFGMGKLIACVNFLNDAICHIHPQLICICRIAQEKVSERFSPTRNGKEKPDILQSFINHGLSEEETVSEALLLM